MSFPRALSIRFISLSFAALIFFILPAIAHAATVVVTGSYVNLRSGPGTGYLKVGQISRGAQLTVVGKSGDWYRVRLQSGREVWIAGWLVKPVAGQDALTGQGSGWQAAALPATVVVTGSYVNLRSGPGTGYLKVGQISRGAQLTVVGKSGDWYRVRLQSGREVWIAGWLVKPVAGQAPAEEPPQGASVETRPQTSFPGTPPVTAVPEAAGPPAFQAGGSGPGVPVTVPVPVSRGESNGSLLNYELQEYGGTTEVTFTFSCPVDTRVAFVPDPPRLVIDIKGLPPGGLPGSRSYGSSLVSGIRAAWFEPETARVVLDLVPDKPIRWEAIPAADKCCLKVRVAPGPLYTVAGKVIVLDPGHGGSDPGAIGPTGLQEKDFNLAVARLAAAELSRRGARVYLTRTDDVYVDLYSRAALANDLGADAFVSVHANAWGNPNEVDRMAGTSTWYAPVTDPASRKAGSECLAMCLQKSLVEKAGRKDLGLFTANFAVLRNTTMPAALVEVAFISNREEEGLMYADWFRQAAATGVVEGLERYFAQI
ncbi:N-acetylmuramoyl-L-alanine amidase [Thermodesulfitimonas autotrophica]|uniref:N-acetylmuramoyl-L-alanine amidase n=1 Tax=Thermodesulfitimonas autotrophica TaxID=1894989 RepID=UPI002FDFB0DF